MIDVASELVPLIERYVSYSEGMNFEGKRGLWDRDEPAPLLMPEEAAEPLVGWAAIDAYWSKSRVVMTSLKSRTANHRCRLLAPNIALVTYDMRWVATLASLPRPPIAADVRVTALLRKKPEGWRYFHLMEGPIDLAGMTRLARQRQGRALFD